MAHKKKPMQGCKMKMGEHHHEEPMKKHSLKDKRPMVKDAKGMKGK